ncbi:MAG: universal stress protein [Phycisphaeraceae bacterium]|nr:universal stress protein [Phycisphaeraceae bacterium]
MKRFKNVLLVASQAEATKNILERALVLAEENGARLTVMEVVPGLPSGLQAKALHMSAFEFNACFAREREKQLSHEIFPIIDGRLAVKVMVLIGKPFIEIIKAVLHHHYDLVMMTAEGLEGVRGKLFSSTALHLMRKCPCPVWMMKPTQAKSFNGILAAVDPDHSDDTKQALNIKIMDLATSLAQREQSKLHIVHVWSQVRENFYGYSDLSAKQIKQLTYELQMQRRSELIDLVSRYAHMTLDSQVHFLMDDPGVAIPNLAARLHTELIVMGTVCRTGLPGLIIGNTAEDVLRQVSCSVLAVKPEGFVSPVTLPE